jgi:putative ABC transport system permease protein
MHTLLNDLRFATRTLRHHPGFALITILTLALGIGANTAIFSVVNGVLLRPLDYPAPERLVFIASQFPDIGFDQFWMDPAEYSEFRDHNEAFQSVGAYSVGAANLGGETPTRPVRALVTHDLMPTLGVRPLSGRWFEASDSLPGARPVALLSWELWQRTFGGDPAAIGRQVPVNGLQTEIIGVMPRGFDVHDQKVELWQILTIDPSQLANYRGSHFLHLIGRLKDDVTFERAVTDTERLLNQWSTIAPSTHTPNPTNHRIDLAPLKDDIVGSVQTALVILQAAVAFVLLIACANLANLLLARAESRQREFAVRTALGAPRSRLLRQFVTEGVFLSVIAAIAGTGLAWGGLQVMLAINPDAIPRTGAVTLDGAVLTFTLLTAIATGIVFGLAPMLHLSQRLTMSLRDGGRGTTVGAMRKTLRGALVVSEVTLAVILVVGAALLVRSFANLVRVETGFDQSSLVTFGLVLPGVSYTPERQVAFFTDVQARLAAIPGVQAVSAMTGLPPTREVNANTTRFEHIPVSTDPTSVGSIVDFYQIVAVGYTETMGIPLVEGRGFETADKGGPPVVLVNETLARRYFGDRPAIGGKMKPGLNAFAKLPWFTVVGVVKDVKQAGLDADVGTELYVLADQVPRIAGYAYNSMNIVVRSPLPLDAIVPQIRSIVGSLDAGLPIVRLQAMDDVMARSVARPRFLTTLLGIFAGLALVLAALGTYGILSYQVTERRQEIGIRMALGAQRGHVIWLVMRHGLVLASVGLLLGVGGAIAVGRYIQTLLFGISPTDPATIALVVTLILVTAVLACLVPSLRATRVDPLVVLQES